MRRKLLTVALVVAFLTILAPAPADARTNVSVSLSLFFSDLAPYGNWVTAGEYGEVWCPRAVEVGWQPYLRGEWRYTDCGWTWVSFDPWGGVPYHYGTWVFTREWGWVWIPGTVWAPAWVTWCFHGDTIGWAPVPPSFSLGLAGYSGPAIVAPARSYVFVPTRNFVGVDTRTVRLDPARNASYVSSARRATNFAVSGGVVKTGGPAVSSIQRVAGAPVRTFSLSEARTRAVPLSSATPSSKRTFAVVAPARDRAAASRPHESRAGTAAEVRKEPGRKRAENVKGVGAPAPKKKVEPARLRNPSRASGGMSPAVVRPTERQHGRTLPPAAGGAERVHEAKPQLSARPPEPPREVKAKPPGRPAPPPHQTKGPPPGKKREPHGQG
ncbi:MAG TPA: DUF6600 domain-containing protein [Thermoanaerobaculia bacterium]|nr:DUF6600 domain-containing protein [Thermoanaerobaculia bacterium]